MYGVKGTSSETVWKKNYVFISAQLEDLYEQECLRAYSIVVGSLGDAVLSKINVVMRDDGSGAVDDDKSTTVLMGDARKLWKVLFGLYEKKTTVAVFISWDKFSTDYLKPGEKVISYVSRLKEIRDRLLAQGDSLSETQLVFKFLNTLTPEYSTVATVLKMKENITFEEAVQKITDYEESQVYKQSKESMILGVMDHHWNGQHHVRHLVTTSYQCHVSLLSVRHLIYTTRTSKLKGTNKP